MGELTLAQFSALVKRFQMREERTEYRNANLIATILNSRMGVKKFITADDLLNKPKVKKVQTVEEQQLEVMKIMHMFGGIDQRVKPENSPT